MLQCLSSDEIFVGSEIMARFKNASHISNEFVPVRILKEFPQFFVCEVLPHTVKGSMYSKSLPYRMTINKWDLDHRNIACTYNFA